MAKNPVELRRKRYFRLSSQIAQLDNVQLRSLFDEHESSLGWGLTHTIVLGQSRLSSPQRGLTEVKSLWLKVLVTQ
jgi:hypothetical protein